MKCDDNIAVSYETTAAHPNIYLIGINNYIQSSAETPPCQKGDVRAVCFLDTDELMVCGYDTGRLEIWHQNSVVYWKKVIMGWELSLLFVNQLLKI